MLERLVTVRLHGPLADAYGEEHRFVAWNPREAVLALDANFPGFRRDFIKLERYALVVDGEWIPPDACCGDPASYPASREIDIVPVIEGRFAALLTPLLGAIGITGVAAQIVGGLIISALLIGVSLLLSPKAKKKTSEDSKKDENFMFSGPENVTEQGVGVPIVYGTLHVGSVVISAGLENAETYYPPAATVGSPAPPPAVPPPGGEATPPAGGWPPLVNYGYNNDPIFGPVGWNYIGMGQSWSPELQQMVTGHSFNSPDGQYSFNSQTGAFYNGPAVSLTSPIDGHGLMCIAPDTRIRLEGGIIKLAADVNIGDRVMGLGGVNTVNKVDRVVLGTWRDLYQIANLFISGEHLMWIRDIDGAQKWAVNSLAAYTHERVTVGIPDLPPLATEPVEISGATYFATVDSSGFTRLTPQALPWTSHDFELIEIGTGGSHSLIAEGFVIGAMVDDRDYDYASAQWGPS